MVDYQLDVMPNVPLEDPLAVSGPVEGHVDHGLFVFSERKSFLFAVKEIIYLCYVYFIYSLLIG